jgi:hypothetical protein
MPALQVAGKDRERLEAHHLAGMDMTERPVVVAAAAQHLERRRRIRRVPEAAATERGVQQADVQQPAHRERVARGQVLGDVALRKALAVHRDADVLEQHALGLTRREHAHVLGQAQLARDVALRVMIAGRQHHAHASLPQARQLRGEEQAGRVIAPIAVEHVAGDQQHCGLLFQAQLDQVLERPPRRAAQPVDRRALVPRQAQERAVDVQIGGVNDLHARSPGSTMPCQRGLSGGANNGPCGSC